MEERASREGGFTVFREVRNQLEEASGELLEVARIIREDIIGVEPPRPQSELKAVGVPCDGYLGDGIQQAQRTLAMVREATRHVKAIHQERPGTVHTQPASRGLG